MPIRVAHRHASLKMTGLGGGDFKSTGRVFGWAISREVKDPTLSQKPREGWGNHDLSTALKMTRLGSEPVALRVDAVAGD
jgi:hypothetical protein